VNGFAIRLGPPTETILICEALEDAMTAMAAMDMKLAAFAVAGAGMVPNFVTPDGVKNVIICADNDGDRGPKEAKKTAAVLTGQGFAVRIAWPPEGAKDLNDLVKDKDGEPVVEGYAAVRAVIEKAEAFDLEEVPDPGPQRPR
jgi:DNA primase